MTELPQDTEMSEAFAAMANAFNRQFRLDLTIESLDNATTIRVTDNQGSGNVKYLGTLRSNWLRRQAPKYGFRSIGHSLLPEVAGGAYVFVDAVATPEEESVDPTHIIEEGTLVGISLVPEEEAPFGTKLEFDSEDSEDAETSETEYRERFLN